MEARNMDMDMGFFICLIFCKLHLFIFHFGLPEWEEEEEEIGFRFLWIDFSFLLLGRVMTLNDEMRRIHVFYGLWRIDGLMMKIIWSQMHGSSAVTHERYLHNARNYSTQYSRDTGFHLLASWYDMNLWEMSMDDWTQANTQTGHFWSSAPRVLDQNRSSLLWFGYLGFDNDLSTSLWLTHLNLRFFACSCKFIALHMVSRGIYTWGHQHLICPHC